MSQESTDSQSVAGSQERKPKKSDAVVMISLIFGAMLTQTLLSPQSGRT